MTSPVSSTNDKAPVTPLNGGGVHESGAREQHILNLNMLTSEPSERKGAFAVCSPTTAAEAAAVYGDGGGGNGAHSGLASVRHSKQDLEIDAKGLGSGGELPRFGYEKVAKTIESEEDPDGLASPGEEVNQSFQTMRADEENESAGSYDEE